MEAMIEKVNRIWCEIMHAEPMWPIHGRYQCRTCGLHYLVNWEQERMSPPAAPIVTWKLAGASK
jgi:hypothetical protein